MTARASAPAMPAKSSAPQSSGGGPAAPESRARAGSKPGPVSVEEGEQQLAPRESGPPAPPPGGAPAGDAPPPPPVDGGQQAAPAQVAAPPAPAALTIAKADLKPAWLEYFPDGLDTGSMTKAQKLGAAKLFRDGNYKAGDRVYVPRYYAAIAAAIATESAELEAAEAASIAAATTPKKLEALMAGTLPARLGEVTKQIADKTRFKAVAAITQNATVLQGCMSEIYPGLTFTGTWDFAATSHAYLAFQRVPRGHLGNIKTLLATEGAPFWRSPDTVALNKNYKPTSYGEKDKEVRGMDRGEVGKGVLMKKSEYSDRMKKSNLWDVMALHEIGHAVDERKGIMDSYGSMESNGGWQSYESAADVATAICERAGAAADQADVARVVGGTTLATIATERRVKEGKLGAHFRMAARCAKVNGAWAETRSSMADLAKAHGGHVFHQSYAGRYTSFALAAKDAGVSHYQFRAEGEWFAELYAFEFSGKLDGHPRQSWVKRVVTDAQPPLPAQLPPAVVAEVRPPAAADEAPRDRAQPALPPALAPLALPA